MGALVRGRPALEGGKRMRGFPETTLLLLSAAVLSSRAGVVPSNKQVVDTLHQVLTAATKETGLRLKRSTSEEEWDKELDLSAIGALFRAKFDNKERPDQGGKVQIKIQRIFISQTEMDEILNNQIVQLRVNKVLLEEEYTVNGQTRYHFKYDNRAPRAEYFLRYAPQDHPETEWWFAGSREVGDNSVELNHKITHGTSVVQKGMIKFDSESTLPEVAVKYVQEVTTSPESPVYPLIEMMLGRHGSKIVVELNDTDGDSSLES